MVCFTLFQGEPGPEARTCSELESVWPDVVDFGESQVNVRVFLDFVERPVSIADTQGDDSVESHSAEMSRLQGQSFEHDFLDSDVTGILLHVPLQIASLLTLCIS